MSIIDTLITDRTGADVSRVEALAAKIKAGTATESELAEWNGAAMKGAYNYTDLNRVGEAVAYLAARLRLYGYAVTVAPKTDWSESDTPSPAQLEAYLADLCTLRKALAQLPATPTTPDGITTVEEANDIESILTATEALINSALQVRLHAAKPFLFCGYALYPVALGAAGEDDAGGLRLYTADGLAVYTADGLAVYLMI